MINIDNVSVIERKEIMIFESIGAFLVYTFVFL
jgi:hypothetical protein